MNLNTEHLVRCLRTLESSLALLRQHSPDSLEYEIYRNAVVKGFELSLETAGKLLRKALRAFVASPRSVAELSWREVFRTAVKHGLVSTDEAGRWFVYRDNRNTVAHDYGAGFAEETLTLLPSFLTDATALETTLRERSTRAES